MAREHNLETCKHARAADPRATGCVKCGRSFVVPGSRDPEYEREFLRQAEVAAARQYGVDATGYGERVLARLALGAERYGDADYLGKDLTAEFLAESTDLAAYALLAAQKALADPLEPEDDVLYHLLQAAAHGAAADYHARQARQR